MPIYGNCKWMGILTGLFTINIHIDSGEFTMTDNNNLEYAGFFDSSMGNDY